MAIPVLKVPDKDPISDSNGIVSMTWFEFFRLVRDFLAPLGVERSATLANNQTTAADITGMSFDLNVTSHVAVEYVIQRITTGTGATELIQAGCFHLVYKPVAKVWVIVVIGSPGPSDAGITFSITAKGQVQYTSSNITGTASISRIAWRARTIAAKHSTYSTAGSR